MVPATMSVLPAQDRALDARVDSVFQPWNRSDSPGCAVGVYRNGTMAYARGYGMANLELGVPITPATVFDIGSTSKQFTAASLVLLSLDGRLSLDDDIRRWIPELPDYGHRISIRHMLHHTSGLRDYIGLMTLGGADYDDVTTAEDALRAIARQRALNYAPGTEWLYSNTGYFLAGVIVERAGGLSLRNFARQRIFEPLGMKQSRFRDDHTEMVPGRATGYSPLDGGGYQLDVSYWEQVGDGSVFTSVEELLRWDQNFYQPTVGGPALLNAMHATTRLNDGTPITYGLGLRVDTLRGVRTVRHGGAWAGYRAELLRVPDQRFSVAVLCNLSSTAPSTLANRVMEIYLADQLAPRPTPGATASSATGGVAAARVSADQLARWTGTYRSSTGGMRVFAVEAGQLTLHAWGGNYPLILVSETSASLPDKGEPLTFTLRAGPPGGRARVTQRGAGGEVMFDQLHLVTPSPGDLRAYAGSYQSDEIDGTLVFEVGDSGLSYRPPRSAAERLQPLERDQFTGGGVDVIFRRAADGMVTGFLLSMGRTRDLRFRRVKREK